MTLTRFGGCYLKRDGEEGLFIAFRAAAKHGKDLFRVRQRARLSIPRILHQGCAATNGFLQILPLMFPNRKPSHVTGWGLAIRNAVAAPCSLSADVDPVPMVLEDKSAESEERHATDPDGFHRGLQR